MQGVRLERFRLGVLTLAVLIAIAAPSVAAGKSSYVWPKADQRGYLAGCEKTSGGNVALCRCQMQWLERRYSMTAFDNLYLHHRKALILAVTRASLACIK